MKNTEKIGELVTGNSNENDKYSLLSEIEKDKDLKSKFNEIKNAWAFLSSMKKMSEKDVDDMYSRFKQQYPTQPSIIRLKVGNLFKYAAIFILGLLVSYSSIYLFDFRGSTNKVDVLTTTVVGEKDQISKIILPDSSEIWVNSGSRISYNSKFAIDNREIKLVGQAFFHAAKNTKIPLVVTANNLSVKVLGTRFDVSAYPEDKNIRVVLESGKVELQQATGHTFHCELAPGEMATYNETNGKVVVDKVEPRLFTAWKDGVMFFRDDPMKLVIKELQRRFDIEIEVKDAEIYKSVFTATINNEPLDKVLKAMEFSCSLKATLVHDTGKSNSRVKVILSKP